MALQLKGKKRGMMQRFDKNGHVMACTVIEAEPNVITQIKTEENDGYTALQLAFEEVGTKNPETAKRRVSKPRRGHFEKNQQKLRRYLSESRVDNVDEYSVGQEFGVDLFNEAKYVDVQGTSKGKGYQGWHKLYGFKGGPASHGSHFHRTPGSLGCRTTPGRVLPGGTPAKRMGGKQVTVQSLEVLEVRPEENLIIVKGSIPGANGSLVTISASKKRS